MYYWSIITSLLCQQMVDIINHNILCKCKQSHSSVLLKKLVLIFQSNKLYTIMTTLQGTHYKRISYEHHMYMYFACMTTLSINNDILILYHTTVHNICGFTVYCMYYNMSYQITIYSEVKNKYCRTYSLLLIRTTRAYSWKFLLEVSYDFNMQSLWWTKKSLFTDYIEIGLAIMLFL